MKKLQKKFKKQTEEFIKQNILAEQDKFVTGDNNDDDDNNFEGN